MLQRAMQDHLVGSAALRSAEQPVVTTPGTLNIVCPETLNPWSAAGGAHLKGTVPSDATCTPSNRMMTSSGCRCRAASATGLTARTMTPFCSGCIWYDSLRSGNSGIVHAVSHYIKIGMSMVVTFMSSAAGVSSVMSMMCGQRTAGGLTPCAASGCPVTGSP